jgi:hypothetical protein
MVVLIQLPMSSGEPGGLRVKEAYPDNPLICGRIKQVLEGEGQSVPEPDATAKTAEAPTGPDNSGSDA